MVSKILTFSLLFACAFSMCGPPNFVDIDQWCGQYIWDQECCKKVVEKVSGGDSHAFQSDNTYSAGLWQINAYNWVSCNNGEPPCDLVSNLRCAKQLWTDGQNSFRAWGFDC